MMLMVAGSGFGPPHSRSHWTNMEGCPPRAETPDTDGGPWVLANVGSSVDLRGTSSVGGCRRWCRAATSHSRRTPTIVGPSRTAGAIAANPGMASVAAAAQLCRQSSAATHRQSSAATPAQQRSATRCQPIGQAQKKNGQRRHGSDADDAAHLCLREQRRHMIGRNKW
nr:uncharacterized protein LOC122321802 [Drosophila bipectinata]